MVENHFDIKSRKMKDLFCRSAEKVRKSGLDLRYMKTQRDNRVMVKVGDKKAKLKSESKTSQMTKRTLVNFNKDVTQNTHETSNIVSIIPQK